uniref:Putative ATP-binding cassette transporter n=1 Tax=Candidatus Kentrum eta TaxID=2126337 RepID=A0A450USK3_9GAMM|nr:MAG: putative ATP-binding cassette transporter [Candidatus Kentron sp. H]VFJ96944.1 MAG: putative ATP-binding cassette transporter [Candidatus Kentron sp. H]VFK02641.1 MAG: putative ATP-binding cassette transporter [Candidatus Kentron sp. H]
MDLVDLFMREFQSRQLKRADAWTIGLLLVLNTGAWIAILDVLNEIIRDKRADFSGLQFLNFVASYLVFLVSGIVSRRKVIDLFEDLIFNIRYRLIEHMRQMALKPFEEIGSATFHNIMTLDLRYISDIAEVLWYLLSAGVLMLGILLYMASLSIPVFSVILMVVILGFLGFFFIQSILTKEVDTTRNREDGLFSLIEGLLFGFKELKIDRRKQEDFFRKAIEPDILAVRDLRKKVGYIRGEATILAQIIWAVMLLFVVFVLPYLEMIDTDTLFAFITAILLMPVVYFLNDLNYMSFANISVDRLFHFEEHLAASTPPVAPVPESAQSRRVTQLAYRDLSFDYTDEGGAVTFSVGPMDLTFTSGEITFIVGGNGSGKSTLLKLITGLYPALTGTVTLDEELVEQGEQTALFSCIFTDFHLFDRFYGLEGIDEERVTELICLMGLDDKVSYQERGFSTLDLSTGQKKRLALIAAMLEDKPFYLFDEWAADQAPGFREYFYKTLLPDLKARNKLVICVTHDDNYYHLADRIYKLELGRLVPE